MQIRLDKYLADAGLGTRSTVRKIIKQGLVSVNGQFVRTSDHKVDITSSSGVRVEVSGKEVVYEPVSYYILYKPAGILSASRDGRERTVVDLVPEPKRRDLFPVGRLDRDTVGLLLITNDGKLSNRLLAPGKHVEKIYRAVVAGRLPEDAEQRFQEGIDIGDETLTAPAGLRILGSMTKDRFDCCISDHGITAGSSDDFPEEVSEEDTLTEVEVTLTEGRYHQIKRMFEAMDCCVIFLKRLSMGGLLLPKDMRPGEVRKTGYDALVRELGILP